MLDRSVVTVRRRVPIRKFDRFLLPGPSVTDRADQRTARLAAHVAAAMTLLNLWGCLQSFFTATGPMRWRIVASLGTAAAAYIVAFFLARTRAFRWAIAILIGVQLCVITAITTLDGRADGPAVLTEGMWVTLAVLTTAMFGSTRWIVAVGLAAGGTLVGTFALGPHAVLGDQFHAVFFIAVITTLAAITRGHHDALEAIRAGQLTDRNEQLLALRDTLEDRVAARTRDLQQSHVELTRAMETLRANQLALVTAEKLAIVGRLTAGIAHEMSSPLSAVLSSAGELSELVAEYERSIGDPEVGVEDHREIVREMRTALALATMGAERSATYVRSIKSQTRASGPQRIERFDAAAVARDAVHLLVHAARAANCRVTLETPADGVPMVGPPGRLTQAVTNLVKNAIDATGERGGGDVVVEVTPDASGTTIGVRDAGPGIDDTVLAKIFEPMFTTKPFGRGTGLGLSIVKEVVEADFGGKITVETQKGNGARFVIRLPNRTEVSNVA